MRDGGLRQLFRKNLPEFDWTSIETGSTGRGIPDTNACGLGTEFWIEFKKTDGWKIGLRPEQIGWITRRARFGGKVFIAVRRKEDELWLLGPEAALGNSLKGLSYKPIGEGGPRRWDWGAVKSVLIDHDRLARDLGRGQFSQKKDRQP